MIEPNILAFQNAAVLESLAEPANGDQAKTVVELAKRVGRDESNLRKTLKAMIAEGLILEDPLANGLTIDGFNQLKAFQRARDDVADRNAARAQAAGDRVDGDSPQDPARWPLDRFRRNPLNRAIDPEAVLGLADTIVGVGDILMPLVVSAPDDDGVRTIWAGERRWMAATRLAQLDQLPEALLKGLPFTERAATEGEAAVIALVENGARQDLTPWEDAKQLRIAAEATGLNATDLARKIGRARDGDRGGVRDVQQKLKIAREAAPEAIAAYEADPAAPGAWETLRASVAAKAAPAQAADDRVGGDSQTGFEAIVTTKAQRLALAELFHKAGRQVGVEVRILPAGHSAEGARLAQYGLAVLILDPRGDRARVTQAGADYLRAEGLDGSIETARALLGFPEGHGVARYRTEWLNTLVDGPAGEATPAADPETRALAGIAPIAAEILTVVDFGVPADWRADDHAQAQTWIEPDSYEAITLLNPKPGWKGWTDAEITLARIRGTDVWVSGYSYQIGHSGALCSMNGIWSAREPAFRTRDEAILDAARHIRDAAQREKAKGRFFVWLDNLLVNDPLVVNGVRFGNATRAGELRRALGIDKVRANHGGGERRAPSLKGILREMTDAAMAAEAGPTEPLEPPAEEAATPVKDANGLPASADAEAESARAAEALAAVRAFVAEDGLNQAFGGWRFRQLALPIGLTGPFVSSGSGGSDDPDEVGVVWGSDDSPIATCDPTGEWAADHAEAQAQLVAYALNAACAAGPSIIPGAMDWPDAPADETPDQALVRTGRLIESVLTGPKATFHGDEDVIAEVARQFFRALRDLELRLAASAEPA